ncbi:MULTISPECIES: hypothetical protein [Flavobacterium]|uniref:Natural product n=1 Tax=Flavobacterium jumunjinense TaxID=998845 RepID=A0ABV5GN24_9FLAO|nr:MULTISPECIES: hypothetical protein [Flavobacterium]
MRKSILNLTGITLLSKEQMKTVEGAGTCAYYIPKCTAPGDHGPWCNDGGSSVERAVSKEVAMATAAAHGGNWCCSSCGSASWY